MGTGFRDVARLLRMSPNTEREYRAALKAAGLLEGSPDELPELAKLRAAVESRKGPVSPPAQEISSIAPWSDCVATLMEKGLTAKPIYDRLRLEEESFEGTYWAVKRMCRSLRKQRGVRAEDVAIPVETAAGEIAQVDFGYAGRLLCPESHVLRRAWVFVMTLAFSRHMYAEVVFDQKTETWLRLHMRAFEFFGGVPETIVPDNLKAAVIRAAFRPDDDTALNRSYRELARHYGFKLDPTPPFAPKKKGKVERSVKYVKRNALAGREGEDVTHVNRELKRWLDEIAGTRHHGTTGRAPLELFREQEQEALKALPSKPYELVEWKKVKIHPDAHASFDSRLYSVPWTLIRRELWLRATASTVAIYLDPDEDRIATHARNGKGKRSTIEAHLPEHRRESRHRSRQYWEERALKIGPETAGLVKEIFDSDDVLNLLRRVQSIVTHLEGFPVERAEGASRRARFYGTFKYRGIKSILAKALDLEPLPGVVMKPQTPGARPRFARNLKELIAQKREVHDEPH
jgi:transposase